MYNEIASNKRKTWFLIIVFCVVVIAPWGIYAAASGVDTSAQIIGATVFASIYSLISYFLADKVALATNGAKQIEKKDAPELWNLVENLCIANGQPVPKIYIVDDQAPNAFATGRNPEKASIAFTTGILRLLDKKELEGVVAHELSHIRNYDIRVMTIVVVLVGTVMLLADVFLRSQLLGSLGRDKDRGGNAAAILMVLGLVLSILTPLLAQLIQLAVSRSREYLADASGALLTRYPDGLASALEKIGAHGGKLQRANHATAHLFIANPFGGKKISSLFATHPPIEERITRLRNMGK